MADVDPKYPGVLFFGVPVTTQITSSEVVLDCIEDLGISVTVPENLLGSTDSEEPVKLYIRPCFCGPFQLPENHEPASPAYLIQIDTTLPFQKDIFIRLHHHTSLQGEEDCDDMAFLSASAAPEYMGSRPVYTFKEIQEAKGTFRHGDQVGEISLRHFSFIKACKRKRKRESGSSEGDKRQRGKTKGFRRHTLSILHDCA